MMREFIAAGLVDHLHVVQVPILLGRGVRLWDGLEALEQQYDVEAVSHRVPPPPHPVPTGHPIRHGGVGCQRQEASGHERKGLRATSAPDAQP